MMRIITLLIFFLPNIVFSYEGVGIALEAPIYQKADKNSKVVARLRKGQKIYIHNSELDPAPHEKLYSENSERSIQITQSDEFFQVLDRNGQKAYIEKKFVKPITHDMREFEKQVSLPQDSTDYRLEEPLPENYPFIKKESHRALLAIGFGPHPQFHYQYPSNIKDENYAFTQAVEFAYLKKVSFDQYDRFYFGGRAIFFRSKASFTFSNDDTAEEALTSFGAGPYISYDIFRNEQFSLLISGGIGLLYQTAKINQTSSLESESRSFRGFSLAPSIGTIIQKNEILESLNLFLELQVQARIGQSLKSSTTAQATHLWAEEDKDHLSLPTSGQFFMFLGLQSTY